MCLLLSQARIIPNISLLWPTKAFLWLLVHPRDLSRFTNSNAAVRSTPSPTEEQNRLLCSGSQTTVDLTQALPALEFFSFPGWHRSPRPLSPSPIPSLCLDCYRTGRLSLKYCWHCCFTEDTAQISKEPIPIPIAGLLVWPVMLAPLAPPLSALKATVPAAQGIGKRGN